jgi:hypothetical protein
MRQHPGCEPLTKGHQAQIDYAYTQYKQKHPNAVARMSDDDYNHQDGTLARLTWLKYWVDYALKHCKSPVFYNS